MIYDPANDFIQTIFDIDGVVSGPVGVSIPFYVYVTVTSERLSGVLDRADTLAAAQVYNHRMIVVRCNPMICSSSSRHSFTAPSYSILSPSLPLCRPVVHCSSQSLESQSCSQRPTRHLPPSLTLQSLRMRTISTNWIPV